MHQPPQDPLLTAEQAAAESGLSLPGWWKAVQQGRMPAPFYPLSRAPRWRQSEVRQRVEATRALPSEQKATRRAERLKVAAHA